MSSAPAANGEDRKLDASRMAVCGDSVGGNMSAVFALMAKERGDIDLAAQVLLYPVTDADFDTPSYQQFAEGYYLAHDGMKWFWDAYTSDAGQRAEIYASPLRADVEQLRGLPTTLVITDEADVPHARQPPGLQGDRRRPHAGRRGPAAGAAPPYRVRRS